MIKIKQVLHGLSQSHRSQHIGVGFLVGLFCGFDAAVCVAIAFEGKDCQYDRYNSQYGAKIWKWRWRNFDWVDFACTVAGGLVGSVLRWLAIGWFI